MTLTPNDIDTLLTQLPFSVKATSKKQAAGEITFDLTFDLGHEKLTFQVIVRSYYPYHSMGHEGIVFKNIKLLDYSHVMEDGSLCIHTSPNPNEQLKFKEDISALHNWILKYYVNKEVDSHYEDIIVEESLVEDSYWSFAVPSETLPHFINKLGWVRYIHISNSEYRNKGCKNFIVTGFYNSKKESQIELGISDFYKQAPNAMVMPYVILKNIPADYGKFAKTDVAQISSFLTKDQLCFINDALKLLYKKKQFRGIMPLLIGYPTIDNKIGWLVPLIDLNAIPWHGEPEIINGKKTGHWYSSANDDATFKYALCEKMTHNSFFGRGCFPDNIIASKILILGIGAIGSIIAKTLVKCGCTDISIYDFDVKNYANCCRSEYEFIRGLGNKTSELGNILHSNSPFVDVNVYKEHLDILLKSAFLKSDTNDDLGDFLNRFDIIFDCTTDDDLAQILDSLNLRVSLINLSISNNAKELVCGIYPGISSFLRFAYNKLTTPSDLESLYNPTGCWNPTFKASYNDMSIMVQYALRHVVRMLNNEEVKQNFILKDSHEGLRIHRL